MANFSFLVKLAEQKFDEGAEGVASTWMMAMPIDNYQHPAYGKVSLTPERIKRFADNVNNGVRGQDLDIDYDHKEYGGEAAGWVKQAEARPDGLWLLVDWTKKAYSAIKEKSYKYFSPEFYDTWTHPSTNEKFKDVLFGGGITNRPFLKGIQPLNLSEFYSDRKTALKENGSMDPEQLKQLATKLELAEDATSEMIFGALMMKLGGVENKPPEPDKPDGPPRPDGPPAQPESPKRNEEQLYSESALLENPAVKKLAESLELSHKKFAELTLETNIKKLGEAFTTSGYIMTPVQEASFRKLLSESASDEHTETIMKTLSDMVGNAGPQIGEHGSQSKRLTDNENDSVKKFSDKIQAKMASEKIDYATAAVSIAAEDAEAFGAYRENSYINGGM